MLLQHILSIFHSGKNLRGKSQSLTHGRNAIAQYMNYLSFSTSILSEARFICALESLKVLEIKDRMWLISEEANISFLRFVTKSHCPAMRTSPSLMEKGQWSKMGHLYVVFQSTFLHSRFYSFQQTTLPLYIQLS